MGQGIGMGLCTFLPSVLHSLKITIEIYLIGGRLSVINHRHHLPSSRVCVESYPILFYGGEVQGGKSKQNQCCKKTVVMSCTQECWTMMF
jgi:hypothetical protein